MIILVDILSNSVILFYNYKWTSSPNVTAMAEFYARMVNIVTTEILAQDLPGRRARVMAKVIKVKNIYSRLYAL
jgi:hypothetical protein